MLDIRYELTTAPKAKPEGPLGFGKIFTDHMFVMDYDEGRGWQGITSLGYGESTGGTGAVTPDRDRDGGADL